MTSVQTKKRATRATQEQLVRMVNMFYENPGFIEGKFLSIQGKRAANQKWEELAEELNTMGGGSKTPEQWQTVWRDLKSRVSLKMRERKKQMCATGNKPLSVEACSELERKVIGLLGADYIEGNKNCPESIPEDEESQLQLVSGNDSVLMQPPKVLSLFSENSAGVSEAFNESPKINILVTPKKVPKRKRVEENSEAQGKFIKIAKQQADSLQMLAEATKITAEAQLRHAEAELRHAEAEIRHSEALHKIADALKDISNCL